MVKLKEDGIYDAYLRKSREDLELERIKKLDTLQQHERFIKNRAKELGIKIRKTYKEVVSGELIQERPEIQKLLKDLETGTVDGVLIVEVERLTRGDAKDQGIISQTFKYSNTKIITLNKIYDPNCDEDEEYFEFGLFMSRREYKSINRRMQRARIASVIDGKYCASVPPFGYRKVRLKNSKGFTLEIDKPEAEIVKKIYNNYKNGIKENKICNWLNTLDVKPRFSDTWMPSTVKDILKNPVYLGKIRWNYNKTRKTMKDGVIQKKRTRGTAEEVILTEGLHPAIIDDETFKLVQNQKENNPRLKQEYEQKNPLAGLVKCSFCGRTLQRKPYSPHKNAKTKLKRKYSIDKEKLRICLREHKGNYSLNDIALSLKINKHTIDHWFANSIEKFLIPNADKWFELKKLLNIQTDEFDDPITCFDQITVEQHEDTFICPKAHCENVGSNLSTVEKEIINKLKEYLNSQRKILNEYNPKEDIKDDIDVVSIKNELEKYKKQLNRAYELVEQGIYTTLEFTSRTKKIKTKIEDAEKRLKSNNQKNQKKDIENLLPKMEKIIDGYYNIKKMEQRNKLLKSIINYVDYTKIKGGKGYENNFTLVIHPKI